jgi:ABC-type nitrate/sulfonate/bicarbonate transport system ATPase subunit
MAIGIEVSDLCFGFGTENLLEGISLRVPVGEIWALIGRSGVGKTTLLQIIAGLFTPRSGMVRVADRSVGGPGRIRGVVFQEDSLLGWLTVEDNVLFPGHRDGIDGRAARASGILSQVGLAEWRNAFPNKLSTGMRKRVEFARALTADDRYLLADEAFSTLDALTRRELWHMWLKLRETEPRTGILSTHDPEEAIRLCDVVVPLIPTRPATLGTPIRVPSHLAQLKPQDASDELNVLRESLVSAIGAPE